MFAVMQSLPKVMIFGTNQTSPATRIYVRVRSDTQICSMYMWMRSVCVDEIGQTKEFGDRCLVFSKGIYVDYASDCSVTTLSETKLLDQPVLGHFAISIRVRKPTVLARSSISRKRDLSRQST
jgi:hypothetical protein